MDHKACEECNVVNWLVIEGLCPDCYNGQWKYREGDTDHINTFSALMVFSAKVPGKRNR